MKIKIPDNVNLIIHRLEENGFEAWAVGGCIRDSILGRKPKDWDITTSALPQKVKEIFGRTIDTGIEHGTVTVMIDGTGYETTTYRIDGKYSDSRHPDSVEFSRSLEEDLKRRDFTINAMAYSDTGGLVDLFDGMGDIGKRIIRCVGDPLERFSEDALRILRAIRFSAQLDFNVDENTLKAACELKDRLESISAERIHSELEQLIMSGHPDRIGYLHRSGIDGVILPELAAAQEHDPQTISRICGLIRSAPYDKRIRWAIFLTGMGTDIKVLRRLKFDNNTIHAVSELQRLKDTPLNGLTDAAMRRLMHDAGAENMPLLFSYRQTAEPENDLTAAIKQYEAVLSRGECTSLKELAVCGRDLIQAGIPAGRELGTALDKLLDAVIEDPELNKREVLLGMLRH